MLDRYDCGGHVSNIFSSEEVISWLIHDRIDVDELMHKDVLKAHQQITACLILRANLKNK